MIEKISRFKSRTKDLRGFTLIELIVSFSILSILSVVGMASFVNYSRSQTLLSDRQKLITVLNTAKANASSQLKNSYCPSNNNPALNQTLNGYSVTINTTDVNNEKYTLNVECINTGIPQPHPIDYPLSKNILFDTNPTNTNVTTVLFPLFTGGAKFYDSGNNLVSDPAQITLTGYGNKFTTTIEIDQTGIIKIIK